MAIIGTAASQEIDVQGSANQTSDLNVADEQQRLGAPVGPAGNGASITSISGNLLTITGITGITVDARGYFLQLLNARDPNNIGTFPIVNVISSSSVVILNSAGSAFDGDDGNIVWILRQPYSLESDLNYERSDRKAIKGVDFYETVQPYRQPNAIGTNVPTNLTNISGKTTDAVAYPGNRQMYTLNVLAGQSKMLVSQPGRLKHMDPVDTLGIPCFDVAPFVGDFVSCFVKILDGYNTAIELTVASGPAIGNRIFGVTNNGNSVSPNSVEVVFYSCPLGSDPSLFSVPYTWEVGQAPIINILYGYNQRLDSLDFNVFRSDTTTPSIFKISAPPLVTGLTAAQHQVLRQLIHFIDEGPGDGFASGAYKVITPTSSIFPTSIVWYVSNTMDQKIVTKSIVWTGVVPTTITWRVYNVDGVTVAHTVSDSITYTNKIFESTRTRTII